MQASQLPGYKVPAVWASSASGSLVVIPPATVAGGAGHMSWTQGIPQECMQTGGIPPYGAEQNGVENVLSSWVQWMNAGAPVPYDSAFSTTIGGYPAGAVVYVGTPGLFYLNSTDNNTNAPSSGTGWTETKLYPYFSTPAPQFMQGNHGGTIGPGFSGNLSSNLFTAPVSGVAVLRGWINLSTPISGPGTDFISIVLSNSINGITHGDSCQISQYQELFVTMTAGQSLIGTLAVTGGGSGWTAVTATYYLTMTFLPTP